MARRASLWLIALALVVAQALGLAHRVAHGTGTAGALALHATGAAADGDLFAAHDEQACPLYDQLAGGALPAFIAALPLLPLAAACILGVATGQWLAGPPAFFDSRGPPSLR